MLRLRCGVTGKKKKNVSSERNVKTRLGSFTKANKFQCKNKNNKKYKNNYKVNQASQTVVTCMEKKNKRNVASFSQCDLKAFNLCTEKNTSGQLRARSCIVVNLRDRRKLCSSIRSRRSQPHKSECLYDEGQPIDEHVALPRRPPRSTAKPRVSRRIKHTAQHMAIFSKTRKAAPPHPPNLLSFVNEMVTALPTRRPHA